MHDSDVVFAQSWHKFWWECGAQINLPSKQSPKWLNGTDLIGQDRVVDCESLTARIHPATAAAALSAGN